MKSTVLKFGMYALVAAAVFFFCALFFGKDLSYGAQEVIGYSSMAVSLIFVFFGIRHFRNKENDGKVSFGKALAIGMLISVFAGLGFAIIDFLYTTVINPDFVAEYQTAMLAEMKTSLTPAEYETESKALIEQMQNYGSPWFMAALMFVTVILMGFVFSLISALILQKK